MGINSRARKAELEAQKNKAQSRKRSIKKALSIGLVTVLGFLAPKLLDLTRETPYEKWYEQNLKEEKGRNFDHPSLRVLVQPAPEEEKEILHSLESKLGKDFEILEKRFYKGQTFKEFNANEKVWKEYENRALKNTTNFFKYIGLGDKIPSIKLERLNENTELILPTEEIVPVYVVQQATDVQVTGEYKVRTKLGVTHVRIIKNDFVGGSIDRKYSLKVKEDGKFDLESKNGPIIISAGIEPISSYWAVPCEVLHNQISRNTLNWMGNTIHKRILSNQFKEKDYLGIQDEAIKLEEGFVHGASESFVEANLKKEGFSDKQKQTLFNRLSTVPEYEYIAQVKAMMDKSGASNVFKSTSTNYNLLKQ